MHLEKGLGLYAARSNTLMSACMTSMLTQRKHDAEYLAIFVAQDVIGDCRPVHLVVAYSRKASLQMPYSSFMRLAESLARLFMPRFMQSTRTAHFCRQTCQASQRRAFQEDCSVTSFCTGVVESGLMPCACVARHCRWTCQGSRWQTAQCTWCSILYFCTGWGHSTHAMCVHCSPL